MIPFSRRELERAWRNSYAVSRSAKRDNAHRLLLFYSVECGLKAVWLRRTSKEILDEHIVAEDGRTRVLHDVNRILDLLRTGSGLRLPSVLQAVPDLRIGNQSTQRRTGPGDVNQVWRYGAEFGGAVNDLDLEQRLEAVQAWIEGELK